MPLEGQVVHSIAPTFVPDLIVPAGVGQQRGQVGTGAAEGPRLARPARPRPRSTLAPAGLAALWGRSGVFGPPIFWKGRDDKGKGKGRERRRGQREVGTEALQREEKRVRKVEQKGYGKGR